MKEDKKTTSTVTSIALRLARLHGEAIKWFEKFEGLFIDIFKYKKRDFDPKSVETFSIGVKKVKHTLEYIHPKTKIKEMRRKPVNATMTYAISAIRSFKKHMNLFMILICIILAFIFASCGDDSVSPNGTETVVYSLDSLILYSDTLVIGDSITNKQVRSTPILYTPQLTGAKTCRLKFNAITNDTSLQAIVTYNISTYTGIFPNTQFTTRLNDSTRGYAINNNFNLEITVNIQVPYGFSLILATIFRNRYHANKYIKLYDIRFTYN